MSRGLIYPYLCVGTGLVVGLWVGIFVIDYDPPIVGWLFGAGAGVSGGAFLAALTTNTPLAGSGSNQRRGVIPPTDYDIEDGEDFAEPSDNVPSVHHNGNGSSPAH